MSYRLNEDTESWNNTIFDKLTTKIKSHFKLNGEIIIKYENNELDDHDDLRDEYVACKDEPDFYMLHLHVICVDDDNNITKYPSPPNPKSPPQQPISAPETAYSESIGEEVEWN